MDTSNMTEEQKTMDITLSKLCMRKRVDHVEQFCSDYDAPLCQCGCHKHKEDCKKIAGNKDEVCDCKGGWKNL